MKKIFFILILYLSFSSNNLFACICDPPSLKEQIKTSYLIIVGKIVSTEKVIITDEENKKMARERGDTLNLYSWIEYKTTVVVTEIYKGKFKGDTIIIFSGDGGGDCGFRFKVGENYIVYGSKIKNTLYYNIYSKKRKNVFGTSTCTRTWNYSNEEIEGIRKYIKRKRIKK